MNRPPQADKQTGKRIVSKAAYVKAQADRGFMGIVGIGLWLSATFVGLLLVGCLLGMCVCLANGLFGAAVGCLMALLLFAVLAHTCVSMGQEAMRIVHTRYPGIPLTRANAADLPAPESLVRASEEPIQEPQTVLLRAATEGQERHEEQLVRAVVGGTEQV